MQIKKKIWILIFGLFIITGKTNLSYGQQWGGSGDQNNLIFRNGNVGIGTPNPLHKLSVNGAIWAQDVIVELTEPAADYVFADNYKLIPLMELEQRLKEDKHLPGIPSASKIKEKGMNLGEMQNKLLEKVEELTLYMIELKKENELVKKALAELKEKK